MSCDTERGQPIFLHYRVPSITITVAPERGRDNTSLLMFFRLPRYPLLNRKATPRNPLGSRRSRRSPWLCSSGEAGEANVFNGAFLNRRKPKSSRPPASVESTSYRQRLLHTHGDGFTRIRNDVARSGQPNRQANTEQNPSPELRIFEKNAEVHTRHVRYAFGPEGGDWDITDRPKNEITDAEVLWILRTKDRYSHTPLSPLLLVQVWTAPPLTSNAV